MERVLGPLATPHIEDGQQLDLERVRHLAAAGKMRKAIRCVLVVLLVLGRYAYAGDCRLESSSCVDSTANKTISGVVVTLADVGGCWEYQDTYTCIKANSIDYCSALTAAGCGQTSSVCSDTAFNSTCNTYARRSDAETTRVRPPIQYFDSTYSLVTDTANTSQCSSYTENSRCRLASHSCVDSTLQARFQWGDHLPSQHHTANEAAEFHGNLLELPGRLFLHRREP